MEILKIYENLLSCVLCLARMRCKILLTVFLRGDDLKRLIISEHGKNNVADFNCYHQLVITIKMYDKFGCVLRIESTCNDIGTFRVKRKVEHKVGSSTEQKAPLKKSIYSLYQLFTIMKAANYRYLEFVSSFDDHSGGKKNLTKATEAVKEKGRSCRGLNFFSQKDLLVLEVISRGEYMTFGMQGKDIRRHLEDISPSAMSRIFKRLRLHGIIERVQGTYKYFTTAYGKEVIAAGLTVRNLVLIPALA